MSPPSADGQPLKRTSLHHLHVEFGARLVPFAGYEMPVQFPRGIIAEHEHTREKAGLFDVSHMGQIRIDGADCAGALEALLPADVVGIAEGTQRYSFLTDDKGGILDDLMIANAGDHLFLVVNAACKEADLAHLQRNLKGGEAHLLENRALLALQGPAAVSALARLAPGVAKMPFMASAEVVVDRIPCRVSRSGYTGEDGFEISLPADAAEDLARRLMGQPEVAPIGLGARDSLRLEAGLCLYGHDIDTTTTPVEAGLAWAIPKRRREAGGFPGAAIILKQLAEGAPRRRVGLRPEGRAPVREGSALSDGAGKTLGRVTSGGFGPSLGGPLAMGYLATEAAKPGNEVTAEVRGQGRPCRVVKLPFVAHRYHRDRPDQGVTNRGPHERT